MHSWGELEAVKTKSLILSKEVLQKRKQLELALTMIQNNIHLNTDLLESLHQELEVLEKHQRDIAGNENFTYKTYEYRLELKPTTSGIKAINCQKCNVTCLESRFYNKDNLSSCDIFGDRKCVKCPRQCRVSAHKIELWCFVFKQEQVTKTLKDLIYEEAEGKRRDANQIIKERKQEIGRVQYETFQFVFNARRCIARLGKIALKPNVMSAVEYIDLLIENEKRRGDMKSKSLLELRRKAAQERKEIKEKLLDETFNPFEGCALTYEVERKGKNGPFKLKKLFNKSL